MARTLGWTVLAGVLLVELAAWSAYGVWGWSLAPGTVLGWSAALALPVAVTTLWGLAASPRARLGGGRSRAAVKVAVLAGAVAGLAAARHPLAAMLLLVAVLVLHLLAALPSVRRLTEPDRSGPGSARPA